MCREDPENRKKLNRYIIIIFKKLKNTCKCSQNLKFYIQGGNTLGIAEINLKKRAVFPPLDQAIHLSINKDYRIHHNIQNEPFFRWKNISTAADSKKRRCRFKLFHPIHSSFIKLRFFFQLLKYQNANVLLTLYCSTQCFKKCQSLSRA